MAGILGELPGMEEEQVAEGRTVGAGTPLPGKEGKAKARRKVPKATEGKELPKAGDSIGVPPGEGAEEEGDGGVSKLQTKREAIAIAKELERRKREFGIASSNWGQKEGKKYVPEQKDFVTTFLNRRELGKKFFLYQGGNGSGKSFICSYIVACLLIPDEWKRRLGLPMVGNKRRIFIGTKSGQNVKNVIATYLIGDSSRCRIPPELVQRVGMDNGILKSIEMKDGRMVSIYTYDAGREIWQGANPDCMWLDEEPTDPDIWHEALARTRTVGDDGESCPMIVSMTPLSGPGTPVLEYFGNHPDEEVRGKSASWLVSSLSNPFADASLAKSFTGHEYDQRVLGIATAPTGLVYREFRRERNVVSHFDPRDLGEGTRYYCGIDFGVTHPTAISMIAVDRDFNHYVFDVWRRSDASLKEIADQYRLMTKNYDLEYTVGDSAAKREAHELQSQFGIRITPADKASKGENGESNRRAGILHINQLMKDGKFVVSDKCKDLIKEYETHYYKDTEKDGQVVKDNDDIGDSTRYCCFLIKKNKTTKSEEKFKNKFRVSWKIAVKGHNIGEESPY